MTRSISAAAITASQARIVRPVILVKMDFSSGFVYLNNSVYSLSFDGQTYTGVGALGGISVIEEGSELQAYGISLELSGVTGAFISLALGEHYQGRDITIYQGFFDDNIALISAPFIVFKGRMDMMQISVGSESKVALTAESRLIDWERPRTRRFTHADQTKDYPGDKGLEFVAQMANKDLVWGRG